MLNDLANGIAQKIGDYRQQDNIQITEQTVLRWVDQFDQGDRVFLLAELKRILEKRYISYQGALKWGKRLVERLAEDYNYKDVKEFLEETVFLDLQEPGKSQTDILALLGQVLKAQFDFDLNQCGSRDRKNFVYLDDILCTGNTAFQTVIRWLNEQGDDGSTNLEMLQTRSANFIFVYIFIHNYNSRKLEGRFYYHARLFNFKTYRAVEIDNDFEKVESKLEFVFPVRIEQDPRVIRYIANLGVAENAVFRRLTRPGQETFFSSSENRIRFEHILLTKSFDILDSVVAKKENMRPLGYTLPSQKTLGFGALAFTWRNIANNTPLVFWYASGYWNPLFEKKSLLFGPDWEMEI